MFRSHDPARVPERERHFVEPGPAAQSLLDVVARVRSNPDAGSVCREGLGVLERDQLLLPEQSPAERRGLDRIRGKRIRVLEHAMDHDAEQAIREGATVSSGDLTLAIREQIAS